MASEIRVNKIQNRSGLGTVTFADTGVDLAGIVTATTFSGSGASLTNIPDSALSSVTASKLTGALPAISGANLTGIAATDNVRTGILDVAGVGTFRGDVNIPDKIIHLGDTDTAIRFPAADTITAETGGNEVLRVVSDRHIVTQGLTGTSFNNDSANAKILEVTGDGTVGEYGQLSLSGNQNSNAAVGAIKFINRENSNSSSGGNANSKSLASIDCYADTSDSNAGDDCGGFIRFVTKGDGSGNAERLRIASNGDLLYASNDRNYASWYNSPDNSNTNASTNSTEILTFSSATISNSAYSTSNGRYTAPVDGLYFVRANGLVDNNANAGGKFLRMYKNGSSYGPNLAYNTRVSGDSTSKYQLLSGTGIMYMSANDYVQIYASDGMHASSETNFLVYLIRGTI